MSCAPPRGACVIQAHETLGYIVRIWRKMQRISWTEKKTNENVRMEIGIEEDELLQQTMIRRNLGLFWTYYAIRWTGKRNDAGMQRGKEEESATKEKMHGWDT